MESHSTIGRIGRGEDRGACERKVHTLRIARSSGEYADCSRHQDARDPVGGLDRVTPDLRGGDFARDPG
jgi:hypothetical protein